MRDRVRYSARERECVCVCVCVCVRERESGRGRERERESKKRENIRTIITAAASTQALTPLETQTWWAAHVLPLLQAWRCPVAICAAAEKICTPTFTQVVIPGGVSHSLLFVVRLCGCTHVGPCDVRVRGASTAL